jgi:TATA-box binding protein (TBP) (component of TFIID and TFIIIB)
MATVRPSSSGAVISNYKISFHARKPLRSVLSELRGGTDGINSIVLHHNFAVIRTDRFVYTPNFSGFVNITKLKRLSDAQAAIDFIRDLLRLPTGSGSEYKVDNITASGTFGHRVPLHKIRQFLREHPGYPASCSYGANYFSGATVRYSGGGTANIFATGAYTIIGAKSEEQVRSVYLQARDLALSLLLPRSTAAAARAETNPEA